jgi:hypothetical protein
MKFQPTRRFGIGDALLLLAATAIGLAVMRTMGNPLRLVWEPGSASVLSQFLFITRTFPTIAAPLLLVWSAAMIVLRLRKPRPNRRRLWSQPGLLACVAAISPFVWTAAILAAAHLAHQARVSLRASPQPGDALFVLNGEQYVQIVMGEYTHATPAILLVWFAAWCYGSLRPERSWIDRAGRALAAAWIALTVIPMTVSLLLSS